MRRREWAASRPELEAPAVVEVEVGAGGVQLAHPRRPLLDEHLHGRGVAQGGPGRERVGAVQRRRVPRPSAAAMPPCA
jgi:hypothetical protein